MNKWTKQPLVYFVSAIGANAIKIGFSTDFDDRLRALTTGCPHELLPVAAIFGDAGRELTAHMALRRYRLRGEWFDDVPQVWDYIEAHANYIVGRDFDCEAFLPLLKRHENIAFCDESAHRGLVVSKIRDAFNGSELDSRQRAVLSLRFGLDPSTPSLTLKQVGERLGITGVRVGQIEKQSLETLARNQELVALHG